MRVVVYADPFAPFSIALGPVTRLLNIRSQMLIYPKANLDNPLTNRVKPFSQNLNETVSTI